MISYTAAVTCSSASRKLAPCSSLTSSSPLVDFGMRQPVGVGDVTSGLLLVKLLQGALLRDALEHVTAAVYEIMLATKNMQEYELQVVAAQDRIAQPEHYFSATQL